jgi:hypothetical protein
MSCTGNGRWLLLTATLPAILIASLRKKRPGVEPRNTKGGQPPPHGGIFSSVCLRTFINGWALAGTASAVPVCPFVPVFQPCHVPALPFGTGKRINRNEGERMQSHRTTPIKSHRTKLNSTTDQEKDIADLVARIGAIDSTLGSVRDLARFYADLAHEVPDESKAVTIDAQALRGTMTFFVAHLENAIESLGMVQTMASLLDDKSDS